jgi:hypothetical protein
MIMEGIRSPLSKAQLELLSLFNNKAISEDDWTYIKEMIARYFAEKSLEESKRAWDENGWDEEKVQELLKTHIRTGYNSNNQL